MKNIKNFIEYEKNGMMYQKAESKTRSFLVGFLIFTATTEPKLEEKSGAHPELFSTVPVQTSFKNRIIFKESLFS